LEKERDTERVFARNVPVASKKRNLKTSDTRLRKERERERERGREREKEKDREREIT